MTRLRYASYPPCTRLLAPLAPAVLIKTDLHNLIGLPTRDYAVIFPLELLRMGYPIVYEIIFLFALILALTGCCRSESVGIAGATAHMVPERSGTEAQLASNINRPA